MSLNQQKAIDWESCRDVALNREDRAPSDAFETRLLDEIHLRQDSMVQKRGMELDGSYERGTREKAVLDDQAAVDG
jgi:hypothetical protein